MCLSEQAITHADKIFQHVYCNAHMQLELLWNVSLFRQVTGEVYRDIATI